MAFGFEPRTKLELALMKKTAKALEMLAFEERASQIAHISEVRKKGLKNIAGAQKKQQISHKKGYANKADFELATRCTTPMQD